MDPVTNAGAAGRARSQRTTAVELPTCGNSAIRLHLGFCAARSYSLMRAAQHWAALDPLPGEVGGGVAGPGRAELAAAVGAPPVVVGLVPGQDEPQVPLAEDQHPVGDLGPGDEYEPFRVGVRARTSGRDRQGCDAGAKDLQWRTLQTVGGWPTQGQPRYAFRASWSGEVPVMAGPGDEIAAGAGGRGHQRASHADREQVIGTLKAAFVQGMLAKDELTCG
jgi:hypothetical protein